MADWLLTSALAAVAEANPAMAGWCEEKTQEKGTLDRLGALRFVCDGLDAKNREAVAAALGVTMADLEACGRVLRRV